MIKSLEIHNFRGFGHAQIGPLSRVNVVVGPNASGKTALLEALFMLAGNSPEISFRLRVFRGLGTSIEVGRDKTAFEGLWRDLFFDESKRMCSVAIEDTKKGRVVCQVRYETDASLTLPLGLQSLGSGDRAVPIVFEWSFGDKLLRAPVTLTEGGVKLGKVTETVFRSVFLASGYKNEPTENAARFSELSKQNREGSVEAAVTRLFPFVRRLSTEINAGVPTIYASVKGMSKKMPVPLISEGVNKYLAVLLAINDAKGGVVLLDEVEDGFYYSTLGSILESLVAEAKANDTQLVMSTHSSELLTALRPLIAKNPDDFSLLRTSRGSDGACAIEQFHGEILDSAVLENVDVR